MIVDTTSLSVMVQSIGLPHKDGDKVRYLAHCIAKHFFMCHLLAFHSLQSIFLLIAYTCTCPIIKPLDKSNTMSTTR